MKLDFPSPEFDDAVAAVCHGLVSDEQAQALNELLRNDAAARDEYILRLELHSRLASDADLFVSPASDDVASSDERWTLGRPALPPVAAQGGWRRRIAWTLGVAASIALVAIATRRLSPPSAVSGVVATSKAVAMLNETAGARWAGPEGGPRLGAPLEPGWLKLEAGLAQVVFYSGARVVIEGPAELELISATHAVCSRGKVTAEVPPQARGFRIDTPQGKVTDLGTVFGLEVNERRTEVHVFKGEVTVQAAAALTDDNLREGSGAVMETTHAPRHIAADKKAFASLFELQAKSSAADALRLDQWSSAGERLNRDPSLMIRFVFDVAKPSRWELPNISGQSGLTGDATIIGGQWGQSRWPGKRALEFQNVNDRVRLNVPGDFDAVTIAIWVRVQGLDRNLNSLFMCDGFAAGSLHWLIRKDGALGITIVGEGSGKYQISTSPPVLTLDRFGSWVHLAVVVDGRAGRVIQYFNGQQVGEKALRIKPPYRIGAAELGNWNTNGYPAKDPFMIRNFSGSMDEFCLFQRPLTAGEIHELYAEGRPDAEVIAPRE
jgi:ferric-dicitrate binding protein FerR (iron transport regulator)